MANGSAGNDVISEKNADYDAFFEALSYVCKYLARRMAGDGEGATKLFEAHVINAKTKENQQTRRFTQHTRIFFLNMPKKFLVYYFLTDCDQ